MKILQILDEPWDSGMTAYGLELSKILKQRGHDVFVCVLPHCPAHQQAVALGLPIIPFSFLSLLLGLLREKFSIVHSHTGRGHVWAFLAKVFVPFVLVRTRGDARQLKRHWLLAQLYKNTKAVIAVSQSIAHQYKVLYPEVEDRLQVIYPGTKCPVYVPPPAGPLRVALVGRLDPVKGHKVFLQAIAHIQDQLTQEQFIIAGSDKNLSKKQLQDWAQELGVLSRVQFMGFLPDVRSFMTACHVGVVASVGSEALSRVALEWMSVGRPVVSTNVGCLPELIKAGVNGLIVPAQDAKALGQALLKLIQNPGLCLTLGQGSLSLIQEKFNGDRWGQQTEEIYRTALFL